nr:uncharacterized protein LOC128700252 [Cherax quadricarinatus]
MYGAGVAGAAGVGGAVPWAAVDARSNAAQNRYLHINSSLFDETGHLEALRQQRRKIAMEDLKQQQAARVIAKQLEKAEEQRIDAAMGVPGNYDPSFANPAAARRDPGETTGITNPTASRRDPGETTGPFLHGPSCFQVRPPIPSRTRPLPDAIQVRLPVSRTRPLPDTIQVRLPIPSFTNPAASR